MAKPQIFPSKLVYKFKQQLEMAQEVQHHVLARYTLNKKVGSGAYGHVWKVTDRKSGATLALKKIFDAFQHSIDAQRTYREICYLDQLSHPNIIKLLNVIRSQNDKDLYLIFEFMEADLHNAIGQRILKDIHNRFIMYQIMKAMKYLHSADVIHRDLKPSNVLINSDCHLKLCDFGLARSLHQDQTEPNLALTEEVATRWYRAPEVLLGSQTYDKSADMWSVGCILAELLIGKPIFPGNSTLNQLERILTYTSRPNKNDIESLNSQVAATMIESISNLHVKSQKDWFKGQVSEEALDLLKRLLQFNPSKRMSASDALNHPYLSQFSNPRQEIISKKSIYPSISDNKKLNLKQYKQLIYDRIKKIYTNNDPPQQYKKSAASYHKDSEIMKEKTNDIRNSLNTKKVQSASKYSPLTPNSNNFSSILEEDKERLRKKQSLKDILKNKREKSVCKYDKNNSFSQKLEAKYCEGNMFSKDKYCAPSPLLAKYNKNSASQGQNTFFKDMKSAYNYTRF